MKLERYAGVSVLGVVVTARCDIAQNKFPVLNYLPLVPLRSWFECDGLNILKDREEKNFFGKLKSIFSQAQISDGLLLSVSFDDIGKKFFPQDAVGKAMKKLSNRYWSLIEERREYHAIVNLNDASKLYNWFASNRKSEITNLLKSLSTHGQTGYYLFEKLSERPSDNAYVCLLRDIASISNSLAKDVANGLSQSVFKEKYAQELNGNIEISKDDLAMPLVCIGSPTIEHLMQTFSNLFARIGIEDPDPYQLTKMENLCNSNEGI